MRAVAERLVLRAAAAARRLMPLRCPRAQGHADQLDPAGDRVRPVVHPRDRGVALLVAVLDAGDRVAQRPRRAFLDRLDDFFGARPIGNDPGLRAHPEDRLQAVGAEAGVGADAAVVVDRDALAGVALAAIWSRVRAPLVLEPDQAVRPVAERLVPRAPAAAQRDAPHRGARLAVGTAQVWHRRRGHVIEKLIRPVGQAGDLRYLVHEGRPPKPPSPSALISGPRLLLIGN